MSSRMERVIARVLAGGSVRRGRPAPLVGMYRWRYEIALLALLAWWSWAAVEYGAGVWVVSASVLSALGVTLAVWPAARRFVAGRYWSVVVQHRLRTGFHETGIAGLSGRLPMILWASPRGEVIRVRVLLPAGVDVTALVDERAALAAATFASHVLVERHHRFANIVVIVVVLSAPTRGSEP